MLSTVVTIALAMLVLGMWIRGIGPILDEAKQVDAAATAPVANTATEASTEAAAVEEAKLDKDHVQGVMLLSFSLVCLLLVVGFASTFREWVRYSARGRMGRLVRSKTEYVDAWKIAGERLHLERKEADGEEETERE